MSAFVHGLKMVPRISRRRFGGALAAAHLLAVIMRGDPAQASDNAAVATDLIDRTGQQVIAILGRAAGDDAEQRKAREIADILLASSDARVITPLVVGKHWRALDPQMRESLIDEIGRYLTYAIGNKLKTYSLKNERLAILGTKEVNERDLMVESEVLTDNYEPFRLDFRVRVASEKAIIIDILVEGISMILTYRNEFDSAISRNGIDGFLAQLREQTAS